MEKKVLISVTIKVGENVKSCLASELVSFFLFANFSKVEEAVKR